MIYLGESRISARVVLRIVVKLTGKLFSHDNIGKLAEVSEVIKWMYDRGDEVAVITGGGELARNYVRIGKGLGIGNAGLDILGIEASRLNALLLTMALGNIAYTPVPRSIDDFLKARASGKVVVMGGLQPGQSTNAVAALIAELVNADLLINATVVDGVYDKDPRRFEDAKLLKEVTVSQLEQVIMQSYAPGHYELLDPVALLIVKRSRIQLVFVNALKPETIKEAAKMNKDVGTWVLHG